MNQVSLGVEKGCRGSAAVSGKNDRTVSVKEGVEISYILNAEARKRASSGSLTEAFSLSVAQSVRRFHQSFRQYNPTPLVTLTNLARSLRVANIWIKDESYRFGLNAFKVLGASYAIACVIGGKLGIPENNLSFHIFNSAPIREKLRGTTFVTATDGNHGRAVAWAAQKLGVNAVVYMPQGSSRARFEAIKQYGAQVEIIEGNYDDAVHRAAGQAQKNGWILVQDSAWEGYEEIPTRIVQGYLTIMHEAFEQLDGKIPTHVFVQCGVGSLASAVQAYLVELFGMRSPRFIVVEPERASCFYKSMSINDGNPHKISGDLDTIMAGLACGEPGLLAWRVLRSWADVFVTCSDSVAAEGMRILANPLAGDDKVVSGESGAVTTGLLACLIRDARYREVAEALRITQESKILLISTEGDTDPDMYQRIVRGNAI
jgi:diaminopropionate ammonia-lyase